MTLRGNAGRLVQGVNNLSGFVKLTEGPGIQIVQSNAKNSLQFSTDTATLDLDDILANGDSTARSAKFLNNASDTIPALIVHNTLDFGSGAALPNVTLKYSPGTPDGLVIGPTTGTDKKIFRSDIIGANTSSVIAVKSGMTFDTGLTLTVDNLVAKSVSNNGDVVAHNLKPYDLAGLTINLDTCTMTCADSVPNPQVSIFPALNCYGTISGTAGLAIAGDFIISGMITTPTIIVPIDLTLKPSGDVRVFSGKTLFCDTISQNNTNNDLAITAVGTNKNINLNPSGTGRVYCNKPLMVGNISNIFGRDITIQPDTGQIYLAATVNASNINTSILTTTANGNLTLSPNGTGKVYVNGSINVDLISPNLGSSSLTISAAGASGNLFLNASGTGQVISNKAFITSVIGSPTGFDITMAPNTGKMYVNGTILTSSGISNEALNGNLLLTPNGTGQVQIASGKILATDIIKSNGATAIAVKTTLI